MRGPVPEIIEQEIDFGLTFKKQFKIHSIDDNAVRLAWTETDGEKTKRYRTQDIVRYKWDKYGQTSVKDRYASFTITKIDRKSVKVVLNKPLQ